MAIDKRVSKKPTKVIKTKNKIEEPPFYKVVMHNDNVTPFDFVISILVSVFSIKKEQATVLAMSAHTDGKCDVGVFPFSIAETKVFMANDFASKNNFPFKLTMEPITPTIEG